VAGEHGGHRVVLNPTKTQRILGAQADSKRNIPYERADHEASDYGHSRVDHAFVLVPAQGYVARHLASFKDFPPRQKPGSFSLDQVLDALQSGPKN
jgi:hypothetical protein